jgi:hypothetical protein
VPESAPILKRVREILAISGDRVGKARRISAAIRETGGYPRVGIHEIAGGLVAWSGPTVGTARSKLVVPVANPPGGPAVGLLGVESDLPDAFSEEDRRCLEECAAILAPLWG